jgi:hypothetical protein
MDHYEPVNAFSGLKCSLQRVHVVISRDTPGEPDFDPENAVFVVLRDHPDCRFNIG